MLPPPARPHKNRVMDTDTSARKITRPWTRREEATLRSLHRAGTPLAAIAAAPGRSLIAIRSRVVQMGLSRAATRAAAIRRARHLHACGHTRAVIAGRLGVHDVTIYRLLRRPGLKAHDRNRPAAIARRVAGLRAAARAREDRGECSNPGTCVRLSRARREAESLGWPEANCRRQAEVLAYLYGHPQSRCGRIAGGIGLSPQATWKVLRWLRCLGYVVASGTSPRLLYSLSVTTAERRRERDAAGRAC